MSKQDNLTDFLTDVADAIRERKGTSDLINPQDFSEEIRGILGGNGVPIVGSIEELDPDAEQGSLASVAVNTIGEAKFSELHQPTSDEVNIETGVVDTTNLSRVSGISINSSYDISVEVVEYEVDLFSKNINSQGGVGQIIVLGPEMVITMNLATQEYNQFELFTANEDGTIITNKENLDTINNLLSSTEFVYGGVMSEDPSYADMFYKTISGIQKTDLYIKDVNGWKIVEDEELKAKVNNLQTVVENLEDKADLIVNSVDELPQDAPLGSLARVIALKPSAIPISKDFAPNKTVKEFIWNIPEKLSKEFIDSYATNGGTRLSFKETSLVASIEFTNFSGYPSLIYSYYPSMPKVIAKYDTEGNLISKDLTGTEYINRVTKTYTTSSRNPDRLDIFLSVLGSASSVYLYVKNETGWEQYSELVDGAVTMSKLAEDVQEAINNADGGVLIVGSIDELDPNAEHGSLASVAQEANSTLYIKNTNGWEQYSELVDGSVTTEKVADEAIVFDKLSIDVQNVLLFAMKHLGIIVFKDKEVETICLTNWDTNSDGLLTKEEASAVTDISEVFRSNTKIVSFDELSNFTNLTSITKRSFDSCTNLTSITIPESVTNIGEYAFNKCTNLTAIYFSENSQLTNIGEDAFDDCKGLTTINIPESVTSIGDWAFYNCDSLASITIPNNVMSIGNNPFNNCDILAEIVVDDGNTTYDSRGGCNAIIKTDSNTLIAGCFTTIVPEDVTSIGNSAFRGCSSLTDINIPESVTSIGNNAFRGCSGLTSINIPQSVLSVGNEAFDGCSSLTAVHISSIEAWCRISFSDSNPLEYAHNLYLNGEIVSELVIPEGVTSIRNYAFNYCSSLTTITIPKNVTSIGERAFLSCSSLTAINIPDSVTSIGKGAFSSCTSLTSINIPKSVTSIEMSTFSFCNNLTEIIIPENSQLTSIGDYALKGCGLTSINIPEGVTSIGEYVFQNCSSLTSITIPASVTWIGSYVFWGCNSLTSVHSYATTPPALGFSVFLDTPTEMNIYVPDASVDAYKAATNWSAYADQIKPMSEYVEPTTE